MILIAGVTLYSVNKTPSEDRLFYKILQRPSGGSFTISRSSTQNTLCLILFSIVSFLYYEPLLFPLNKLGGGDWDQFVFYNAVPRKIILTFQQIPLWNPYYCGGLPILSNPQDGYLRPTYIFPLLFGSPTGLKIEIWLMAVLGLMGMYFLSKQCNLSIWGSLFSAGLFVFSSYFSLHFAEGQLNRVLFLLLPLTLYFFKKCRGNFNYLMGLALLFLWMLLGGGLGHVLVPTILFLLVYSLIRCIHEQSIDVMYGLMLALFVSLSLGAIKFVPVGTYLIENPRTIASNDFIAWHQLDEVFLDRDQTLDAQQFENQKYGWHEYGAYSGYVPLLLLIPGTILGWKKDSPLFVTGFFFLLLSMGNFSAWSPWSLLHSLPGFDNLRVPSRLLIFFVMTLALANGYAVDRLLKITLDFSNQTQIVIKYFIIFSLFLVILDVFIVSRGAFKGVMAHEPPPDNTFKNKFKQIYDSYSLRSGSSSSMFYNFLNNRGTVNCYEFLPHKTNVAFMSHPSYRGEQYILPEGSGSVKNIHWSPNHLEYRIQGSARRLVVNQNYHHNWHKNGDQQATNYKGLISTTVDEEETIKLTYHSSDYTLGLWLSCSTMLTLILFYRLK